ncbi:BTB/POZ domain-containing protein 19-like [Branchiostoma lanceolatum]|uniref:BTB/POZ domain-containing protein 19-like n=1 Tax=Branchiostoma lanceolatum TaxID=7740 RepID=UPI003454DCF5
MSGEHNERLMVGDVKRFAEDARKMVNSQEFSDVKFVIGEERRNIYGHRCLLASRCEVFRVMFADHEQRGKDTTMYPFVLQDTNPDIFLSMLEYIYTSCVTLDIHTAIDVLAMSVGYGLGELTKLCEKYICDSLSVNSASEAIQAAVTYSLDDLGQTCLAFIEDNMSEIVKTKGFHELSDTALAVILQSDRLALDEPDVLEAVRDWATVNSVVVGKPVAEVAEKVIGHVRLPLLVPDELSRVEQDNKDQLVPVEQISFTWKFHAMKTPETGNPIFRLRRGTVDRDHHKVLPKKADK